MKEGYRISRKLENKKDIQRENTQNYRVVISCDEKDNRIFVGVKRKRSKRENTEMSKM